MYRCLAYEDVSQPLLYKESHIQQQHLFTGRLAWTT